MIFATFQYQVFSFFLWFLSLKIGKERLVWNQDTISKFGVLLKEQSRKMAHQLSFRLVRKPKSNSYTMPMGCFILGVDATSFRGDLILNKNIFTVFSEKSIVFELLPIENICSFIKKTYALLRLTRKLYIWKRRNKTQNWCL